MRFAVARTLIAFVFLLVSSVSAWAAPYAAMVIDARSGKVLHSRNADQRLHPASLTKMMTLYVVFDAIRNGEITLDTPVKISRKAANEQPSRLGLEAGQKIALRYLIRAAAVKSANDAATAMAEAIEGSEAAFAKRMNRTARALGMTKTTFKNAHGLTRSGHLSTARDMTTLGRRLFFDFPQYYNLFSRRSTNAGVREVASSNRKFLKAYRGADGIKTGYTSAAGFNLVASAHRGEKRIIATVFGGKTTAWRNQRVAELLDMGFKRAPAHVAVRKPPPVYLHGNPKTVRVAGSGAVASSLRPRFRSDSSTVAKLAQVDMAAIEQAIQIASKEAENRRKVPSGLVASSPQPVLRVVTRISSAGGRVWAVQVGTFSSRQGAEKALMQTALRELETLEKAERYIDYAMVQGSMRYRARFKGLNQAEANMTCARLRARAADCLTIRPGT